MLLPKLLHVNYNNFITYQYGITTLFILITINMTTTEVTDNTSAPASTLLLHNGEINKSNFKLNNGSAKYINTTDLGVSHQLQPFS